MNYTNIQIILKGDNNIQVIQCMTAIRMGKENTQIAFGSNHDYTIRKGKERLIQIHNM